MVFRVLSYLEGVFAPVAANGSGRKCSMVITSYNNPRSRRVQAYKVSLGTAYGMDGEFLNFSLDFNISTYNSTNETRVDDIGGAVAAAVFLGTIVCMTVSGNVLVLLAVFVNSHLRSTTNYFIVNLAIADLLLGTTVLPFSATLEVLDYWPFGQNFCDIWAAVDVLCCTASIMSLCAISLDRYIGVTRPLQHSTIMSEKRAGCCIVFIWILSLAISLGPLIGWKEPPDPDPRICTVTTQLGYVLFSVCGSFYIPLLIILVVYFRIYREAIKQSRFLSTGIKTAKINEAKEEITLRIHMGRAQSTSGPGTYQSSSSSEHSEGSGRKAVARVTLAGKIAKFNREKKAAKTLGIVVGVFILCWFPFFFMLPIAALCPQCYIPPILFQIIFWLGYCNSLMNPIIYACSHKEYQRAFKRILLCSFHRRPRVFLEEQNASSSMMDLKRLDRGCKHAADADHNTPVTKKHRNSEHKKKNKKARRDERVGEQSELLSQKTAEYPRFRSPLDSPIQSLMRYQNSRKFPRSPSSFTSEDECVSLSNCSEDEKSDCSVRLLKHAKSASSWDEDDTRYNRISGSSFAADEEYVNAVLVKKRNGCAKSISKSGQNCRFAIPDILINDEPSGDCTKGKQPKSKSKIVEIEMCAVKQQNGGSNIGDGSMPELVTNR